MSPILLPEVGKTITAHVTRIDRQQAKDVFTNKKTGEFSGQYSKPTDVVYSFYGTIEGKDEEVRLGTVNAPKNQYGQLFGTAKLFQLIQRMGIAPELKELSDDLHELVGKSVPVTIDKNGFVKLFA